MEPPLDIPLEIFGQNDVLSIMTPFVYIFPCEDPDISKLTDTIQAGVKRWTEAFPWLAGKIINTGRTETSSGVFKIVSPVFYHKFRCRLMRSDFENTR